MPRFYFNICDDEGIIPDLEGMEFRNLLAVKREAEASARELLVQDIHACRKLANRRLEVANERGDIVATIHLRDLIH